MQWRIWNNLFSATSTREMSGEQSSQGTPSQWLRARIPIVPPFLNAPNMKKGLTQFKAHVDSCHADLKREQRGNAWRMEAIEHRVKSLSNYVLD